MDAIHIIIIVVSIILAFAIGANNETYATIVGIKSMSVRTAVIFGAIITIIGGYFLSKNVGHTLREDISPDLFKTDYNMMLICIYAAMSVCLILVSIFGLPISSTESMVGAILGLSFAQKYEIVWGWSGMGKILFAWFISPMLGFVISYIFMKFVNMIYIKTVKGLRGLEKSNAISRLLLLAMIIWTGLSRAGNDINNAIAPIVYLFDDPNRSFYYQNLPMLFGGIALGLGLILIGHRVLKTLGNDVVELTPESAFVTEGSAALIVFVAVILGIPISGTNVLIATFIGAGLGIRKPINLKTFKIILFFIVLTPIISGGSAVICYYSIRGLF
ncbi:MAG: inorganic phosphate transporter [Candidatus Heimdallarchaeota archaeon]|nr:inorganic phosphate transporter [Candidatus Heimdallarchaeota archaeon]